MSTIHWTEAHTARSARWHCESATPSRTGRRRGRPYESRHAYRLACEGTALLWRGDFHNARQLLQAMRRRIDRKPPRSGDSPAESFHLHRRARSHRARVLSRLLVLLEDDHSLALRRAPDVRQACAEAYGPPRGRSAVSFTELLGVIGAQQWREKGVEVPALNARIHPHYGVFSPVRDEYVDLVAQTPLPAPENHGAGCRTAFDLGEAAGLHTVDKIDTRPRHPRAKDATDPLHVARAAEVTSLWRLAGD